MEMVKDIELESLGRDSRACLNITREIVKQKRGYDLIMEEIKNTDLERLNNKMVEFFDRENIDNVEIEILFRKFVKFLNE